MEDNEQDFERARQGIALLLNNKEEEAESLFAKGKDNVHIAASHCFARFMNALMTFEEERVQDALDAFKEMEKMCAHDVGWLTSVRNSVFSSTDSQTLAHRLEEQIILADCQVGSALLTFLIQRDKSAFVRGGWALRKAWKIYQHTYSQILNLYRRTFGTNQNVPGSEFPLWQVLPRDNTLADLQSPTDWAVPSAASTPSTSSNGIRGFLSSSLRTPFSLLTSAFSASQPEDNIPPNVVARLMAGVSFGYGIFQLCVSYVPPPLLRFIHFLGFEGDRNAALSALNFTRQSNDFRAPLATLALLWYHTILCPFFASSGNGEKVKKQLEVAEDLLTDSTEFRESALFLYFEGRLNRIKCNTSEALRCYENAVKGNPQREVQLLCLHEVAMCHLIQLDYEKGHSCFYTLMNQSRWSNNLYNYMVAITAGSSGKIEDAVSLIEDLHSSISDPKSDDTGLEILIWRRVTLISKAIKKFPADVNSGDFGLYGSTYFQLMVMEFLYMYNFLPSCSDEHLDAILDVCLSCNYAAEPMAGLRFLIAGSVWGLHDDRENSISCFRQCLSARNFSCSDTVNPDIPDKHITVFALYELGVLLIDSTNGFDEGKEMLTKAQNDFKDYDNESAFSVKINHALQLSKRKSEERSSH
ncbi:tetratricopeptide repeat protein 39C-like [Thrips palmi]|uniref:Tetratricopeptide repeat protein 39C-like n=1 Tax=Thrips palmi TaxID=161013 RepID=A0A6P8YRZ1_THRPL|nr:tetratricopeptide repeat protein 39C-like [Thrips palmi]XP_034242800.1 tetratricopeptide repeat protein 39C-like [Thrips palmi]XP_034242801.1 tetratricopeptide repeat protein 39C-like [Thrips palmi]XP_034242802.1 tetratricopeptide repeat protein 39C-like [Thrips palmi]XP_034242803.1 tetratricopeptide repeat protein 39C-like [Thrips palmi]XP_034242804.1 tetratricopeptide repeat protein 39C-like [Thrips palmi]XP_034242805.1 tetratricopeptide repeat protein 39C-like [Thrips palmi]XP_03424280